MKIVIPGGTGQIGTILARDFHSKGHDVVILSRTMKAAPWKVVQWDAQTLDEWVQELEGADVLINLTGKSVNCRYNWKNRWKIIESRVRSIRVLGYALAQLKTPPAVWLQAGTATIYANRFDAPNDEATGIIGGLEKGVPDTWRFSIDVARSWEGEFALMNTPKTRKVVMRSAMTMSPDRDGIFDYLLWLVRCRLGGKAGSGNQYISWLHYDDFIAAINFLIEHDNIDGVVNIASPHPIPNSEFMRLLRKAQGISLGLPATEWMLEFGAIFLRTETELVLKSRRVVPGRLLDLGFCFQFPNWDHASKDLCERWARSRRLRSNPPQ